MRLKRHATVFLVDDVDRATDYYRAALGFDVETFALNPGHYAYANRDECSLHFARFEGVKPRPNSEAVPPDMFDVYVYPSGDLDALHLELVERAPSCSTGRWSRDTECASFASATHLATSSRSVNRWAASGAAERAPR